MPRNSAERAGSMCLRLGLWWRSGLGLPLRVRLCQRTLGLRLRTGSGLRLRLDGHKLHLEDEGFIWADGPAIGAAFAVGTVGRNEELPFGADRHKRSEEHTSELQS